MTKIHNMSIIFAAVGLKLTCGSILLSWFWPERAFISFFLRTLHDPLAVFHIVLFCIVAIVWCQAWMLLSYANQTVCFTRDDNASFKPTEIYRLFWVFHFHQLSCIRKAKYLYPCRFPVRKGCFVCDRVLMDF